MSRLIFKEGEQKKFLNNIKIKSGLSFKKLGKICSKNPKNLSDWYLEKSIISYESAIVLANKFNLKIPTNCKILPEYWYTSNAGKIGGKEKIKKYGNPGTPEGRRLGGLRSQKTHKKFNTRFKRRQKIKLPLKNEKLSEFFGIMIGDGGISRHQINITLSKLVDTEYSIWLVDFIKKLFNIKASRQNRKNNSIPIIISRTNLVDFLTKNGLPSGNKIKCQVDIPKWIIKNKKFSAACVRGLMDTDGCVYIDKHNYKNKIYGNICLDFTSGSKKLLSSVYKIFQKFKLEPKIYEKSVKIRKNKNVIEYFKIIGSHNEKHINKFKKFTDGEVA